MHPDLLYSEDSEAEACFPFRKTNRKIRIQYFKKLKAILYLLLCHIKFITLLTSGYDHQIIDDQLLSPVYRFPHGACTPREYLYTEDC